MTENQYVKHANFSCFEKTTSRQVSLSPEFLTNDVGLPRIKICTLMHQWKFGKMDASPIKMTRGWTRVYQRCCLALGISRSYILSFLLDEFYWLIVLRLFTGEEDLLGFSGQPKSGKKIIFWVNRIGRPNSRPLKKSWWWLPTYIMFLVYFICISFLRIEAHTRSGAYLSSRESVHIPLSWRGFACAQPLGGEGSCCCILGVTKERTFSFGGVVASNVKRWRDVVATVDCEDIATDVRWIHRYAIIIMALL